MPHAEHHRSQHSGWLRAAVLGANDGLLSIGGLMLGVAASHASQSSLLLAGVAALVAGAISMGAGEYVSVSSQVDTERADLELEQRCLEDDFDSEHKELTAIYVRRGLNEALASEVARQLMAHDALGAHARDEIGITETTSPRPTRAALVSAVFFSLGAFVPIIIAVAVPFPWVVLAIGAGSLVTLSLLGALAAAAGGADPLKGALRVVGWGIVAMAATWGIGHFFGAAA